MADSTLIIAIFAVVLAFIAGRAVQRFTRSMADVKLAAAGVRRARGMRNKSALPAAFLIVGTVGFLVAIGYVQTVTS